MPGKASEDLFVLIKSLSMPEKRYFKAYATLGNEKEDTIYVRLFDAIDAQKEYDEKKVLKKIALAQPQQLSNQKKYLSELILESCRLYNSKRTVDAQLWSMIAEIEFLYRKRLLKLCMKQCKKAKELAQKYEKHIQLAAILTWEEKNLGEIISQEKMEAEHDQLFVDSISNAKKIVDVAEYRSLHHQMLKPARLGGLSRWGKNILLLNKIIQHPKMKAEPSTYRERFYYYSIFNAYYIVIADWEKCHTTAKKLIAIMEERPHEIATEPRQYTSALNVFIITCVYTRRAKELDHLFPKVTKMISDPMYTSDNNNMFGLLFCCNSILNYCVQSGEFEKGVSFSKELHKFFNDRFDNINKGIRFSVYLNFANVYFGTGDYKQALSWLNKIMNDPDSNAQDDYYMTARLFSFIVHYERDDDSDLERFVKSAQRFMLSKKRGSKIEASIIDFIHKKIAKKGSRKEMQIAFKELKATIELLSKDPIEKVALFSFDFVSWLDSKIQNQSFGDALRDKWSKTST